MPEDLLNDSTAIGYLRSQHQRIEALIASCLETNDLIFAEQVTVPLVQELEVHSTLEEQMFLPFMAKFVDHASLEPIETDNAVIQSLAQRLKALKTTDPEFFVTLQELGDRFRQHEFAEEESAFLPVEMNDPDTHNLLVKLAWDMKDMRERILSNLKRH